ncbi:MAG: NifB/NifX family molybdenum-iron cluster-binding protein [Anaerolineales bacterium]|jgi:predicted Fe-Mo cluster-binding NifX family protein
MNLAISVNEPQFDAALERRFGRCRYFIVIDTDTIAWAAHENPAAKSQGGAGPGAAQFLADMAVSAVISGDYGPKAFTALQAANIEMYAAKTGTAEHLLQSFLAGDLEHAAKGRGVQHHGRQAL